MSIRWRNKANHTDVTLGGIPYLFSRIKNGLVPHAPSGSGTTKYLREDGTWQVPPDTTYGVVSKTANGLAPHLPNETTTTKYLRQDGTWQVPPDTNSTYPDAVKNITRSGTTFTATRYSGGTFTFTQQDNNTWRPVQNNLTSTSTSDCLSAYQGKVLNEKINVIVGGSVSSAHIANTYPQGRLFEISAYTTGLATGYTICQLIINNNGQIQVTGYKNGAWTTIRTI